MVINTLYIKYVSISNTYATFEPQFMKKVSNTVAKKALLTKKRVLPFNSCRPNPGRKEKINLSIYFQTSLRCLE